MYRECTFCFNMSRRAQVNKGSFETLFKVTQNAISATTFMNKELLSVGSCDRLQKIPARDPIRRVCDTEGLINKSFRMQSLGSKCLS